MLVDIKSSRLMHLATQLQGRVDQGNGKAYYEIGVDDDGNFIGLTKEQLDESLDNIKAMAEILGCVYISERVVRKVMLPKIGAGYDATSHYRNRLGYSEEVTELIKTIGPNDTHLETPHGIFELEQRYIAEVVIVRKKLCYEPIPNVRVVLLGDHLSGKSTLVGHLVHGECDDGRGKCRLYSLRHRHEIESGETSSVSRSTLRFDANNEMINQDSVCRLTAEELSRKSKKLVTLLDTCGKQKYRRTTIQALLSDSPHVACLALPSNSICVGDSTIKYLKLLSIMNIPVFILFTKFDLLISNSAPDSPFHAEKIKQFKRFTDDLKAKLRDFFPGVECSVVGANHDMEKIASKLMAGKAIPLLNSDCISPDTFTLKRFLGHLERGEIDSRIAYGAEGCNEFLVQDVFTIPDVGCVVSGRTISGTFLTSLMDLDSEILFEADDNIDIVSSPYSLKRTNGGELEAGNMRHPLREEPEYYYVGPDSDGNFHRAIIRSIQSNRIDIERVGGDEVVSMALEFKDSRSAVGFFTPQRGMIITNRNPNHIKSTDRFNSRERNSLIGGASGEFNLERWIESYHRYSKGPQSISCGVANEFVAKMKVVKDNSSTISLGYQATIYSGTVAHIAEIKAINIIKRSGKSTASKHHPSDNDLLHYPHGNANENSSFVTGYAPAKRAKDLDDCVLPGSSNESTISTPRVPDESIHQDSADCDDSSVVSSEFGQNTSRIPILCHGDTAYVHFQFCNSKHKYLRVGNLVLYIEHPDNIQLKGEIVHLA
ncbi:hypothetical protein H4219_003272 [Mycoemilia scoparia]|uniref:Tr-type G domain-containing protein n=1 Tax=Mycoemilia scoparia TaxID=417184 RepID=A0A9W8A0I9_9FUNG|nr:hypothetical protein H4219_003272 [Mycoemilia scoparia]